MNEHRPLSERPSQAQLLKMPPVNKHDHRYIQNSIRFLPLKSVNINHITMRSYFVSFIHYLFIACLPHQNTCSVSTMILSIWFPTGSTVASIATIGASQVFVEWANKVTLYVRGLNATNSKKLHHYFYIRKESSVCSTRMLIPSGQEWHI